MSLEEVYKEFNLAYLKLEMEKSLEQAENQLKTVQHEKAIAECFPLESHYQRLYYLAGFIGLLQASDLAVLSLEFVRQITQEGTVYSKEFPDILNQVNSRLKTMLDAMIIEEDEGVYIGVSRNVILSPRLKIDVPINDLVKRFKTWLINLPEVTTMRKIRIEQEGEYAHTIKIPPHVLRQWSQQTFLTLVYLDVAKHNDLDLLIGQIRDIEEEGAVVLQGPLEIPYESFIDNNIKRPYFMLLETYESAESFLHKMEFPGKVVRVLKRPVESVVKASQPKVIVKEVPFAPPEMMKALHSLTEERADADDSVVKKKSAPGTEKVGAVKMGLSIGFKMIFIISIIILASLVGLTAMSSRQFTQEKEESLKQDYLNQAKILGDAAKEFFKARINAVDLLFLGGATPETQDGRDFMTRFFQTNRDIIYIRQLKDNGLEFINENFSEQISQGDIDSLLVREADALSREFIDLPYIFNPSYLFNDTDSAQTVVLGMTAYSEVVKSPVLILVNARDYLKNNFPSEGVLYTAYVVNDESQIIFHSNPELVTASRNVQRRQIDDLVILEGEDVTGSESKITEQLFNIGSEPIQNLGFGGQAFKNTERNRLRLRFEKPNEEGEIETVGFFAYIFGKILGVSEKQGYELNGTVIEIMREIENGRDLNMVLGAYKNNPVLSWIADRLDRNKVRYYVYLQRIQAELDYHMGVVIEVEIDRINEAVNTIIRRNIMFLIVVLALTMLAIYFFSKTLTTPMRSLVRAARKIEAGNYDLGLKIRRRDELGVLTGAFIDMGLGLEEKEQMKDAFGRFVNEEVAEMAMRGEIGLGGERKQATIFFSDIRSFTAISEKLDPEEVVGFLNEYMTLMVDCVKKTNGFVDKYIGDAIMAVWGTPISYGNDEENCINGALMMRTVLKEFNKNRGGDKKPIIKIGCGINSGPVLAGQIGSDERMEYTVIGDAVNLASRIEALNKPMGTDILISQQTADIVKDIYDVVPMNKIKVKGKAEPQQIYAVLGRYDDPSRPKNLEEMRALVGIEGDFSNASNAETEEHEVKYEILD